MIAALASTGQSLRKVKELLEEAEREWMTRPAVENRATYLSKSLAWEPLPAGPALIDYGRADWVRQSG
jgi:hypothetical protein